MIGWIERLQKVAPISTWVLFGAGIALTALQIAMVLLLWLGQVPRWKWLAPGDCIGVIAILQALDLMAVIVSLSHARVAVRGPGGFSADVGSEGPPPPAVTVTTEVNK